MDRSTSFMLGVAVGAIIIFIASLAGFQKHTKETIRDGYFKYNENIYKVELYDSLEIPEQINNEN